MVNSYVRCETGYVGVLDLRLIKIVEVIEDDDSMSGHQKLLDKMRSNKTRATCHQNSHGTKLATDDDRWTPISRLRFKERRLGQPSISDLTTGKPSFPDF